MATYNLREGTGSPVAAAAHLGPQAESFDVIVDFSQMRDRQHNVIDGVVALDVLELLDMPQYYVLESAMIFVARAHGATGLASFAIGGTTLASGVDLDTVGVTTFSTKTVKTAAGELLTMTMDATSVNGNARVNIQGAITKYVPDEVVYWRD